MKKTIDTKCITECEDKVITKFVFCIEGNLNEQFDSFIKNPSKSSLMKDFIRSVKGAIETRNINPEEYLD